MSSRWMYDVGGLQFGPVTFLNLAELIRDRQLCADDRVCRADGSEWTCARDVVGLMHAVRSLENESAAPQHEIVAEPDEYELEAARRQRRVDALRAEAETITLRKRRRKRRLPTRGTEIAARVLLVWMGLVAVLIAGLAFYNHVHDPWADKRFEDPPVDHAAGSLELMR